MFPVFILSRLCLKRRFQFFGISVDPPEQRLDDHRRPSFSSMTVRRPTCSAFSHGTLHGHVVVEDLDREVLPRLAENLALLLPHDCPRAVVRIDDLVADVEQEGLPDVGIRRLREKVPAASSLPAIRSHDSAFFTGD